jgi:hypothetical protein
MQSRTRKRSLFPKERDLQVASMQAVVRRGKTGQIVEMNEKLKVTGSSAKFSASLEAIR